MEYLITGTKLVWYEKEETIFVKDEHGVEFVITKKTDLDDDGNEIVHYYSPDKSMEECKGVIEFLANNNN